MTKICILSPKWCYFEHFCHILMYFHVIGHVLLHKVEKIGFEVIEGITLAALVSLPPIWSS